MPQADEGHDTSKIAPLGSEVRPPAAPLCRDCVHYLKAWPGHCRLATILELTVFTLHLKLDDGRLRPHWRCVRQRSDGDCGRWGRHFIAR